jgi:transposase-like protein
MNLNLSVHGSGRFRCSKNQKHRDKPIVEIQILSNTWFDNLHMSIEKTLLLTYAFSTEMSYKVAIRESSIEDQSTSDATIASRYSLCQEICMIAPEHRNESERKIGGEARVVEIDESKIGRRKFNKGRIIDGNWILGMIDLDGGYRLEICPENKRDKTTLRDLIIKNVANRSAIMTVCWKGYEGLNEIRFQHLTVNNYNFVDPETWANSQRIESSWRPLRKRLSRGGIKKNKLASHLCEYMWRKEVVNNKKDPFEVMLDDIRNVYQMN